MSDDEDVLNIQPKELARKRRGQPGPSKLSEPPVSANNQPEDATNATEPCSQAVTMRDRLRPRPQQQQQLPPKPKPASARATAAAQKHERESKEAARVMEAQRAREHLEKMNADEAELAEVEDDPLADAVDETMDFSQSPNKFKSTVSDAKNVEPSEDEDEPDGRATPDGNSSGSADSEPEQRPKRREPVAQATGKLNDSEATVAARKRAGSESVNKDATVPKKKRDLDDVKAGNMRKDRQNLRKGWEIEEEEVKEQKKSKKKDKGRMGGMQDSDVEMERDDIEVMSKGQRRGGGASTRVIPRVSKPVAVNSEPEDSEAEEKKTPVRPKRSGTKRGGRSAATGPLSVSSSPSVKTGVGKACLPRPFQRDYVAIVGTVIEWAHALKKPWELAQRDDSKDNGLSFESVLTKIRETFEDSSDQAAFIGFEFTPGSSPFTHLKQRVYKLRGDLLLNANKYILNLLAEEFKIRSLPGKLKDALAKVQSSASSAKIKKLMAAYCEGKWWFYGNAKLKAEPLRSDLILMLFGFYLSRIKESLLQFPDSRAGLAICVVAARRASEAWKSGTYNPPVLGNDKATKDLTDTYLKGTIHNICVTQKQYHEIAELARSRFVADDQSGAASDEYDSTMDTF